MHVNVVRSTYVVFKRIDFIILKRLTTQLVVDLSFIHVEFSTNDQLMNMNIYVLVTQYKLKQFFQTKCN